MRNENLKRIREIAAAFKLMLIAGVCVRLNSARLLKLMCSGRILKRVGSEPRRLLFDFVVYIIHLLS